MPTNYNNSASNQNLNKENKSNQIPSTNPKPKKFLSFHLMQSTKISQIPKQCNQLSSIQFTQLTKPDQKLPDQSERVPDINSPIDQTTGNETERELFRTGDRLPPRNPVEPLGARRLSDERHLVIVGLEIELEQLKARRRAERQIHRPRHRPRRHVRRVRRQRHRRRSTHPLYARHSHLQTLNSPQNMYI